MKLNKISLLSVTAVLITTIAALSTNLVSWVWVYQPKAPKCLGK
jgi:cyclic lactone autoinducer peptide